MNDTSPEAEQIRLAAIRRMDPVDRMRQALAWSESMRALAVARLRERHPDWSELQAVEHMLGHQLIPLGHPARDA